MIASLPQDAAARKAAPMAEGLLYYFPNALAEVARVSKAGNDQHNPGQPMHHARGKSMDHADCIIRHLVDAGTVDSDGQRHSAKVAWRALALLQEELEREEGCPVARNARTNHAAAMRAEKISSDVAHDARRERYNAALETISGFTAWVAPSAEGLTTRVIKPNHDPEHLAWHVTGDGADFSVERDSAGSRL